MDLGRRSYVFFLLFIMIVLSVLAAYGTCLCFVFAGITVYCRGRWA